MAFLLFQLSIFDNFKLSKICFGHHLRKTVHVQSILKMQTCEWDKTLMLCHVYILARFTVDISKHYTTWKIHLITFKMPFL